MWSSADEAEREAERIHDNPRSLALCYDRLIACFRTLFPHPVGRSKASFVPIQGEFSG